MKTILAAIALSALLLPLSATAGERQPSAAAQAIQAAQKWKELAETLHAAIESEAERSPNPSPALEDALAQWEIRQTAASFALGDAILAQTAELQAGIKADLDLEPFRNQVAVALFWLQHFRKQGVAGAEDAIEAVKAAKRGETRLPPVPAD